MKSFSSLLITVIFGILIENMLTKYLLVDLEKESKDARGPGKMIIRSCESITLDLLKLSNSKLKLLYDSFLIFTSHV